MAMCCLPVLVGLGLLFLWRWMKIQETQQRIDLQAATPIVIEHEHPPVSPVVSNQFQNAYSTDHVRRWLEEVKRKLIAKKEDDDDKPI